MQGRADLVGIVGVDSCRFGPWVQGFPRPCFHHPSFGNLPGFPAFAVVPPCHRSTLAAAVQPLEKQLMHLILVFPEHHRVASNPVVVPIALELAPQDCQQVRQSQASRLLQPFLERQKTRLEFLPVSPPSHIDDLWILLRTPPVEVKAEEGELLSTHATVLIDPGGTLDTRRCAPFGAGFSILLLDLLPHLNTYGAVSTFRRVRAALWPAGFPVYASIMLFPHPSASKAASGFMLFTR